MSTLYQVKQQFHKYFSYNPTISVSTIWRIFRKAGLTYKVVERRALQVKIDKIANYVEELNSLSFIPEQLLFLDEVSFDNRDFQKKKGYFVRNRDAIIHGHFSRRERVSLLAFCNINGLVEVIKTEGTFSRYEFIDGIRTLINNGKIGEYPGRNSVWIMDGAAIHMDANIFHFLRAMNIKVLVLPPFCPFYNPIEYLFGFLKSYCTSVQNDDDSIDTSLLIGDGVRKYSNYDMTETFIKCGYNRGYFDPGTNYHDRYQI